MKAMRASKNCAFLGHKWPERTLGMKVNEVPTKGRFARCLKEKRLRSNVRVPDILGRIVLQ